MFMLKVREGFIVREILDEHMLIGVGSDAYTPNCLMSLSETAAFMWDLMTDGIEKEELIRRVLQEYDAPESLVRRDLDVFLNELHAQNLLEEA